MEALYCSYGDTVHYLKEPKIFARCKGSWLYDIDDIPYLDMQMWYSAVNFGYGNDEIMESYGKQLATLPQLATQYLHREKILLAWRLSAATEKAFGAKGRIHFNVGGSQAVEDALKLVRSTKKGRSLMISFMGGYHGRTLGATEITSSFRYRQKFGHFANRALFVPYPYCFRCFYEMTPGECRYECVRHFEKLFETEYYGVVDNKGEECEFAAFFVEPLQATGGYIAPPPEYFPMLARILEKHGILMVDDEIQMGIYRTGKFWAMEHFGVTPDVITFAKSLTNGLNPLSGLWAKEELINPEAFPPGSTHSTFASNPLGTAAALATLEFIDKHDFASTVPQKGRYLLDRLRELRKEHPVIGDVGGLGLAVRVEITKSDGKTPDRQLTDAIFQEGMKGDLSYKGSRYGLVLDVGGYYKNIFTLAPPLTISGEEMDLFIELFGALLKRLGV
ncbi:MAG: aminotransferase class III-fold pyridoxal phosphate-dependent enzyme [Nitrospirae bacterium]|nr:aminotransferase class III-fold pyridoxal phosphate-dependent enzyme [Nitrospirota bacterium]